jgi:myo-inositol-1(or 4)-monophosphatase
MNSSLFLTLISQLKPQIHFILDKYSQNNKITKKNDGSYVTELDLEISNLIELEVSKINNNINFLTEEKKSILKFPSIILDPIDGTSELILGVPEYAISLAFMESPKLSDNGNLAWIYNPVTKEEYQFRKNNNQRDKLLGYISRSEVKNNVQKLLENDFLKLELKGSIAYKLLLLANGQCDFIISKYPKNIWDIAAGTIICHKLGIKLYQNGIEIQELNELKLQNNLLWCFEKDKSLILSNLA